MISIIYIARDYVINFSGANFYFGHISTSDRGPEAIWIHDNLVVMVFDTFSNIQNPIYPDPTVILLVPDIVA